MELVGTENQGSTMGCALINATCWGGMVMK